MKVVCARCGKEKLEDVWVEQLPVLPTEEKTVLVSHRICPECGKILYPGIWEEVVKKIKNKQK